MTDTRSIIRVITKKNIIIMETKNKGISAETRDVIGMLSSKLGVDITDKSRKRGVTTARFVAFYWLRKNGYTCMEVAEMFGMHHSTVSYGVQEVDDFLSIGDKTVKEMCYKLIFLDVEMLRCE